MSFYFLILMYNILKLWCENLKLIGVKLTVVSLAKKISSVYKFLQVTRRVLFINFFIFYNTDALYIIAESPLLHGAGIDDSV